MSFPKEGDKMTLWPMGRSCASVSSCSPFPSSFLRADHQSWSFCGTFLRKSLRSSFQGQLPARARCSQTQMCLDLLKLLLTFIISLGGKEQLVACQTLFLFSPGRKVSFSSLPCSEVCGFINFRAWSFIFVMQVAEHPWEKCIHSEDGQE